MTRRMYAGGAAATRTIGDIASSGGGTVQLEDFTGWPDGSIGNFHVVVDAGTSAEEKVLVKFRTGNVLTFDPGGRGADGTVSTSHSSGAPIWLCITALDIDEANAHLNASGLAHNASAIYYAPAGSIGASNVQSAIQELDSEAGIRLASLETALALVLAPDWVTNTRMGDASVGTAELIDASVTAAKLAASVPRGYVTHVQQTTTQSAIGTSLTDLTTLTATFTAVAGRRYRIHIHTAATIAASASTIKIAILEGATVVGSGFATLSGASFTTCEAFAFRVPGAGSVTYKAQMSCNFGTVNAPCSSTEPMFLEIEDIGGA